MATYFSPSTGNVYWVGSNGIAREITQILKDNTFSMGDALGADAPDDLTPMPEAQNKTFIHPALLKCWNKKADVSTNLKSKYHREIKPGVFVDVYDVLHAWNVQNPALQHLIKKALQPGERGHKDKTQDMKDIVVSAKRAQELEEE